MSHFVVAVLTKNHPENVCFEDILAKYEESIEVPRYVSMTKEQIIQKRKEEIEYYKKGLYADYLKDPEGYRRNCKNEGHLEYISNTFPNVVMKMNDEELYQDFISKYPTKDEIEYEGEDYVDENGNLTSTYNPYAKWDWWVIGGRWSGELPLKSGEGADYAKIGDVEWGNNINIEEYIEKNPDVVKSYNELITKGGFCRPEYYKALYPTIDEYVRDRVSFIPFALIDIDGVWYEKGKMGWFGISNETTDEAKQWHTNFYEKFIKGKEDYFVTLVDCHI